MPSGSLRETKGELWLWELCSTGPWLCSLAEGSLLCSPSGMQLLQVLLISIHWDKCWHKSSSRVALLCHLLWGTFQFDLSLLAC